ncbi:MAG: pentapeptide repeat-containing protein [Gammaproteobacteria bacterium]|nr:pentapeptide repeat-containing protein [Gammaproteobacteria bacterium]
MPFNQSTKSDQQPYDENNNNAILNLTLSDMSPEILLAIFSELSVPHLLNLITNHYYLHFINSLFSDPSFFLKILCNSSPAERFLYLQQYPDYPGLDDSIKVLSNNDAIVVACHALTGHFLKLNPHHLTQAGTILKSSWLTKQQVEQLKAALLIMGDALDKRLTNNNLSDLRLLRNILTHKQYNNYVNLNGLILGKGQFLNVSAPFANLCGIHFNNHFRVCNFRGAYFVGSTFENNIMEDLNLSGANFNKTTFIKTTWANNNSVNMSLKESLFSVVMDSSISPSLNLKDVDLSHLVLLNSESLDSNASFAIQLKERSDQIRIHPQFHQLSDALRNEAKLFIEKLSKQGLVGLAKESELIFQSYFSSYASPQCLFSFKRSLGSDDENSEDEDANLLLNLSHANKKSK